MSDVPEWCSWVFWYKLEPIPPRINLEWMKRQVAIIYQNRHDDEMAHGLEDSLREVLLAAIASGNCDEPVACCGVALTTKDIDFERWCA